MNHETQKQTLRHAVIGVGAGIFSLHKDAINAIPEANLVGVADVNAQVGAQRAEELGVPFYPQHQVLLADQRPDVTAIITPHPFHAQLAVDALEAGSHVIVEKPMAVHVGEADRMIAAAEANDRLLVVNFQHRYRPEVMAVKKLLSEGGLGKILRVTVVEPWIRTAVYFRNAGWRGTWRGEGGGVLMNQAPHGLDLICHFFGLPRQLFAWTRTVHHAIETEDTVTAMLEWADGSQGTIYMSTAEAGQRRMEIAGTGGTLLLGENDIVFQRFDPDLLSHIATDPNPFAKPGQHAADLVIETQSALAGHAAVYRNLYDAILHGAPLLSDGRQGRQIAGTRQRHDL